MDWITLQNSMPQDRDLPERANKLNALSLVLQGKHYAHLRIPFSRERLDNGEYVPLDQRRPAINSNLCRTVVDDATSLLFSEAHFPQIHGADPVVSKILTDVVKCSRLNQVMHVAARKGSIGSVAILLRILKGRVFFSVLDTAYLTPVWDPYDPNSLTSVSKKFKISAKDAVQAGYQVDEDAGDHWIEVIWDQTSEIWYLPYPVRTTNKQKISRQIDEERSVEHQLGFCPIVWIRNTPVCDDEPDGECTFEAALDTVLEYDLLASQNDRGLKYSADPTLWIKEPSLDPDGSTPIKVGGAANVIVSGDASGDAKVLETSGEGSQAMLGQCEKLRQLALEIMHGNRANSDKFSAAQSGRAMELMNQGLVWLADRMRITYGEGGLLDLLRLVCRASSVLPDGIEVDGELYRDIAPKGLMLIWPAWFAVTSNDLFETSNAIKTLTGAGTLSRRQAVKYIASMVGVEDVEAELAEIEADQKAQIALLPPTAVTVAENP